MGGLVQGNDCNLNGSTYMGGVYGGGVLFKISPTGTLTLLHTFYQNNADGAAPTAAMTLAGDGNFYGTTFGGDPYGEGTVFKMTPAGVVTILHSLLLLPDHVQRHGQCQCGWRAGGRRPHPRRGRQLLQRHGLRETGGNGTVYKITPDDALTSLSRDSATGVYTATLTLQNTGYMTASGVRLTKATLGPTAASTTLPVSLGDIPPESSAVVSLSFPASAGASGSVVALNVTGVFSGGKFSGSIKVMLP